MNTTAKRAAFYHDLSVLLEAGIPILRSLDTVTAGLEGNLNKVFSDVRKSVSEGESVSDSMVKHKKMFGELDVMLVQTAEMSGNLPECFRLLTNWYEFRNRLMRIIKTGLMIPLLVLHRAAFIIPLREMFLSDMTLGGYFIRVFKFLAFFYMSFILILVIYKLLRKNRGLSKLLDAFLLRIPVWVRASGTSQSASTAGRLICSTKPVCRLYNPSHRQPNKRATRLSPDSLKAAQKVRQQAISPVMVFPADCPRSILISGGLARRQGNSKKR